MKHETLLVVDFGSQVTQLIARRVRELGVYAEIVPYKKAGERIAAGVSGTAGAVRGIVLSGGPASTYDVGAPKLPREVLDSGVPLLGICYGMYALVEATGGTIERASEREF